MPPIEKLGGVAPLDSDGCIVNPARLDLIAEPWLSAVRDVTERCRAAFSADLHSVYIRGSVPRGLAVPGLSDLDAIAALRDFSPMPFESEVRTVEAAVQARFGFLRGVELAVIQRGVVRAPIGNRAAIVLKTQAVCLFGPDLLREIPPLRPGPASFLEAPRLPSSIDYVLSKLRAHPSGDEVRAYCVWIMKILVRAAFEFVQALEGGYTRDLYFCAEAYARHYPSRAGEIWQAVEWVLEPLTDPAQLRRFLEGIWAWG
jgi:hypothetical protein